jgi:hypothetical protein
MNNSLIKYQDERQHTGSGKQMFWQRAELDGFPFRGQAAPILKEEEYEARVRKVGDAKNGFFDVGVPAENAAYLAVCDRIVNGWYQCLYIERFWNKTTRHYVEWVEFYMEDGSRAPFSYSTSMETYNRNRNGS